MHGPAYLPRGPRRRRLRKRKAQHDRLLFIEIDRTGTHYLGPQASETVLLRPATHTHAEVAELARLLLCERVSLLPFGHVIAFITGLELERSSAMLAHSRSEAAPYAEPRARLGPHREEGTSKVASSLHTFLVPPTSTRRKSEDERINRRFGGNYGPLNSLGSFADRSPFFCFSPKSRKGAPNPNARSFRDHHDRVRACSL